MATPFEIILGTATLGIAIYVAFQTQRIAKSADTLSAASNNISHEANRIEAEKVLICWAQRVASNMSQATALRIEGEKTLAEPEFYERRRSIRTELLSLLAEGQIILQRNESNVLKLMSEMDKFLKSKDLKPPQEGDYEAVRRPQVHNLRRIQSAFVDEMQNLVNTHWLHGAVAG
ncbi:hypothetical protein [Leisingera sp. S232]|uniref:hypothetical protein n=1 Tax=Leisingera sp. S232 TaxID=3415132 RepID=UPI00086C8745|nr:hypothetical protein AB838_17160 [Rhodobacteraceae bacterium (ex Bugula neritina AB1)]